MADSAIKILLIVFVAWVIWSILQPRYIFEIRIRHALPAIRKGKVTSTFLAHVAKVCDEEKLDQGWIGGVQAGRRIALRFSRHFPPGVQQRLRNEWQSAS